MVPGVGGVGAEVEISVDVMDFSAGYDFAWSFYGSTCFLDSTEDYYELSVFLSFTGVHKILVWGLLSFQAYVQGSGALL